MRSGSELKEAVRKQYAKIALSGNSGCSCIPGECCTTEADPSVLAEKAAEASGYDASELGSIPNDSILGVGCGAPLNFADPRSGETVVDLGSGAGIDVFMSANRVGKEGRVIGIDMTDEMLQKARRIARENGYTNVEFRKGDIEQDIPVEDISVDLVISNCVINLTENKVAAFGQVHRILKPGGRMVISDLVTDREVHGEGVSAEKWCRCVDGAMTRENYLNSIRNAGFEKVEVLQDRPYIDEADGRRISSLVIRATKT